MMAECELCGDMRAECELCKDYGFILSNDADDKDDLQKCDDCNKFKSDEEAKKFVLKYINH